MIADQPPWVDQALCAQTDPEAFFPEKGGSTLDAKKTCVGCDVRSECLEYALEHDEQFGVWGGLSALERRKLHSIKCTIACIMPGCTRMFAAEVDRDRHVRQGHLPPKNPVTCPDCGRVFAHSGAMFHHTNSHRTAS